MNPPWTDTGAPVRHANTYSDVGDHVAFGVDPPCDRQIFLSCRLLSARLLDLRESVWNRSGSFPRSLAAVGSHRSSRASCQKRRAGKKRINSGSVFPGGSPQRPPSTASSFKSLPTTTSSQLKTACSFFPEPHSRPLFCLLRGCRTAAHARLGNLINILTCLAAWTLPAPAVYDTCVLAKCLRQVVIRMFCSPRVRLSVRNAAVDTAERAKNAVSTFPPPLVDITSKTWPSFADMLLRRWREGGTFGGECFPAPLCHTSAPGSVKSAARAFSPPRRCAAHIQHLGGWSATLGVRRCL